MAKFTNEDYLTEAQINEMAVAHARLKNALKRLLPPSANDADNKYQLERLVEGWEILTKLKLYIENLSEEPSLIAALHDSDDNPNSPDFFTEFNAEAVHLEANIQVLQEAGRILERSAVNMRGKGT